MSVTDTNALQDKVIAITGAGSGIGAATAQHLAARGAAVVLAARTEASLTAVAARIGAAGGRAAVLPTDVTRRADLVALVAHAVERFGRLDVLVSNAGAMPIGPLDDLEVDAWDRMVDVNLKGVLHGIAAALPVFRAQGGGHFVNVASTAAHRIVPTMAVYAATKTAVRVLSEGLRQEAGPDLRVTVVSPGMTATEAVAGNADMMAIAMPPDAVARSIAFAVEQPPGVDVGEVIVRPTAQS
jgi:NADP-dependent 3-hydroxy acid dehydrogenase YdfG